MARLTFTEEMDRVAQTRAVRRARPNIKGKVAVILASNRPNDLLDVFKDIERQSLPTFELLLGCHGFTPSVAMNRAFNRLKRRRIDVRHFSYDPKVTLGSMLTDLARKSKSEFVAKMDDDDIYGPEHLRDLLDVINEKKCEVVGRAMNYIYLEPIDLTVRRFAGVGVSDVELFSDWICGGTILVTRSAGEKADWFGSGTTAVDTHLLSRVTSNGGKIYRTFGAGYIYRRRSGQHTYSTNYGKYLNGIEDQWVGLVRGSEFGVRP